VEPVTDKDIVLAVLSGSVSLAGLLLVFSGFLFAQATGFDPEHTDDAVINRYRRAAKLAVIPFLICLGLAVITVWWLVYPNPSFVKISWIGFIALLVLTAVYGGYTILRYL
jgi:hypothetical protein